ncbi:uncharacterized protein NPIL_393341 [Nephila pilipes]|uniref:Uncharacterized protein n=1 Tax=Nephila pilipes TaxID=299642 RepID=A0A8X6QW21_NEPPI|nr:uncharacterized protein NPIL_393341 [Nephila pilipes]
MFYPETHEQCWWSMEEHCLVERWHLIEIGALYTISTCQDICLTSQFALQRKRGLSLYLVSSRTTFQLKGVMFILNVGTRNFSMPCSDVMAMNISTNMECHLIVKHNLLQKSFIIADLVKHICSKHEPFGTIPRFAKGGQLQFIP